MIYSTLPIGTIDFVHEKHHGVAFSGDCHGRRSNGCRPVRTSNPPHTVRLLHVHLSGRAGGLLLHEREPVHDKQSDQSGGRPG